MSSIWLYQCIKINPNFIIMLSDWVVYSSSQTQGFMQVCSGLKGCFLSCLAREASGSLSHVTNNATHYGTRLSLVPSSTTEAKTTTTTAGGYARRGALAAAAAAMALLAAGSSACVRYRDGGIWINIESPQQEMTTACQQIRRAQVAIVKWWRQQWHFSLLAS